MMSYAVYFMKKKMLVDLRVIQVDQCFLSRDRSI